VYASAKGESFVSQLASQFPGNRPEVRVAVVGLGFGAEFVPIYQNHPLATTAALCQRDAKSLNKIADDFGVEKRFTSFEALLADPDIDAVHISTPIPMHASQSIAALRAGKHVACTVPMATTIEDCETIVDAASSSQRSYMMMETRVYSREYLFVQDLVRSGQMGRIQFLRGAHHQDMQGWPGYWEGLPPMYYATHAISPLLAISGRPAAYVHCHGSGRIADHLAARYGSPFAVESALVRLHDSELSAEISRSLFETAREYVESFAVYGSLCSFEWEQTLNEGPVLFEGTTAERVDVPDYADLLPAAIRQFTTGGVYSGGATDPLFVQSGGHGGSHPHLVHEFISSIIEARPPWIDAGVAANWTCVGICAHASALDGGARVALPSFTLNSGPGWA
jgi:predicted dehydrogenase